MTKHLRISKMSIEAYNYDNYIKMKHKLNNAELYFSHLENIFNILNRVGSKGSDSQSIYYFNGVDSGIYAEGNIEFGN
jgi:hypothetical protein